MFTMKAVYLACCLVLLSVSSNCDDGKVFRSDYQYFAEADGWFKLHSMLLNWQDARLRCAYEGAMLASPTTYGINAVMKSFAVKNKVTVYTGIHATLSNGDFNTLDGIPFTEMPVRWLPGNPNNYNNIENCIVYHAEGLVEDVDCNNPYPYICYKRHSNDLNMTECGTTDIKYKLDTRTNKCYKFHWIGRSYNHASAVCSAEGGHLAIINSELEAEVLRTVFAQDSKWRASYGDLVRLGFYNWHESNFFGTLHGQSLEEAGYDRWKPGEPTFYSGSARQKCGGMFRDGLLDDTTCEDNMPFICEKHPDALRISGLDFRFGQ